MEDFFCVSRCTEKAPAAGAPMSKYRLQVTSWVVFWVGTPCCILVRGRRRFRGTCCLRFRDIFYPNNESSTSVRYVSKPLAILRGVKDRATTLGIFAVLQNSDISRCTVPRLRCASVTCVGLGKWGIS